MNAKQAKKLNMLEVLSNMGFTPAYTKKGGNEYWYRSPFRKEKTPSFHITYKQKDNIWVWKDFGEGRGGNVLDFVMRYRNENVGQALKFLRSHFSNASNQDSLFPFHQPGNFSQTFNADIENETSTLELIRAVPIQNFAIEKYLEKVRKIPKTIFQKYLYEVHYWNKNKNKGFFAFGMKNESGGYEIRSASDDYVFKSALIKRDITFIQGRAGGSQTVNIFEGMIDYLSLLAMWDTERLNGDSIIMHSTTTFDRTTDFVQQKGYAHIHTFLDNDATGKKYTEQFQSGFKGKIYDKSVFFGDFEDLNDMRKADVKIDFSLIPRL